MAKCACCDGGKEIKVSFCPSCKSRSVGYVFGVGNLFGVMPKMKCKDCEFSMPSFPILVVSEKDLARNSVPSRRGTKVPSSSGKKAAGKVKKKAVKKVARRKKK